MLPLQTSTGSVVRTTLGRVRWIEIAAALAVVLCVAIPLRLIGLGNAFETSDNAELAVAIPLRPGYEWVQEQGYGLLNYFFVKVFAATVCALHVHLTEFWWKLPIALFGVGQSILAFFLLRAVRASFVGCVFGACIAAVCPILVMNSRDPYGKEIIALFFLSTAVLMLHRLFERPSLLGGLACSACIAMYLLSHGYVIPFVPSFAGIVIAFAPTKTGLWKRLQSGFLVVIRSWVWAFPVAVFPLTAGAIAHTLAKKTKFGFYLPYYLVSSVHDIGIPLALLCLAALATWVWSPLARAKAVSIFVFIGSCYLAPFWFGTPSEITVVRDYMPIGTFFMLIGAVLVFDRVLPRKSLVSAGLICSVLTIAATVSCVFHQGKFLGVEPGRGSTIDTGVKAAGVLIRRAVPANHRILALHRNIENPNFVYYFGREDADNYVWEDLTLAETRRKLEELGATADLILCEELQVQWMEKNQMFHLQTIVATERGAQVWIYVRGVSELPAGVVQANSLNADFDREFTPTVSL